MKNIIKVFKMLNLGQGPGLFIHKQIYTWQSDSRAAVKPFDVISTLNMFHTVVFFYIINFKLN